MAMSWFEIYIILAVSFSIMFNFHFINASIAANKMFKKEMGFGRIIFESIIFISATTLMFPFALAGLLMFGIEKTTNNMEKAIADHLRQNDRNNNTDK